MKGIFLFAISAILISEVCSEGNVEQLTSALRESFGNLSSRRNQWFDNYSELKRVIEGDEVQLKELLVVSKMAIPMVWLLYRNKIKEQKATMPHKFEEHETKLLPYEVTFPTYFPPPGYPSFHMQVTMMFPQEKEDFQIELSRDDGQKVFVFSVDFDEEDKRAVYGSLIPDSVEHVVLTQDEFPEFPLHQPFRMNIQVNDDCVFAQLWLNNLELEHPMPPPKKYHWCSGVFTPSSTYTLKVLGEPESQSEEEEPSSEEEEEEDEGLKILDVVVYGGIIIY